MGGCAVNIETMPYNRFTKKEENITSSYGWRKHPITGVLQMHYGIDTNTYFSPIYDDEGNGIDNHWTDSIGGNIATITWNSLRKRLQAHHCQEFNTRTGDRNSKGAQIAKSGKTGNVTGPHTHWELHDGAEIQTNGIIPKNKKGTPVDPTSFIFQTRPPMPQQQGSSDKFITVQDGWGLSNVAKAAGLNNPGSADTWAYIYNLNQGYRGSTNWDSLNKRMGGGDILRVRPDDAPTTKPAPPVEDRDKEIIDLQDELNKYKLEAQKAAEEAKAKEDLLTAKLAEERELQQKLINEKELEYQKQVTEMKTRLAEIEKGMNIDISESIRKIEEKTGLFSLFLKGIATNWALLVDRYFGGAQYLGMPGWFLRGWLKYNAPVLMFAGLAYLSARIPLYLAGVQWNTELESALGLLAGALGFIGKDIASQFYDTNKDGKIDLDDLQQITN